MTIPPASRKLAKQKAKNSSRVDREAGLNRISRPQRLRKYDSIEKSAKKKKIMDMSVRGYKVDFNYIFIGNFHSAITPERLESFFDDIGGIKNTLIRCAQGQNVSVGVEIPAHLRGPRDRLYATMEFVNSKLARKALAKNGQNLDGCRLVVSPSPADLPEVANILEKNIAKMLASSGLTADTKTRRGKALRAQATELLMNAVNDRHDFFGFSFTKTVT